MALPQANLEVPVYLYGTSSWYGIRRWIWHELLLYTEVDKIFIWFETGELELT